MDQVRTIEAGAPPARFARGWHCLGLADRFCLVECWRCGAVVRAAKFSPQHTSVQWSAAAVRACAEFSAAGALGRPSALVEGCGSLRDSIDAAVTAGRLEVRSP